jgi:hypothetical protein
MDLVFYPGDYIVQGVHPFLTAMTSAKGLVFCFCQQPNDVLTLVFDSMIESFDRAGRDDVL